MSSLDGVGHQEALDKGSATRASGAADARRAVLIGLKSVLFAAVFLQRIGIPVGTSGYVSPVLLIALGLTAYLWRRGILRQDSERLLLLLAGIAFCSIAALLDSLGGAVISITSFGLLVVMYLPFAVRINDPAGDVTVGLLDDLLVFLTKLVGVVATIAVLQTLTQWVHVWNYHDLLAYIVPVKFLVQGYHTSYPITYGSSLYKANGVFMLEPSFCSQFVALGLITTIKSGIARKPWLIVLFLIALVCTASGTGVILLVSALAIESARRGPRFSARVVGIMLILGAILVQTPIGKYYETRSNEFSSTTSSGNSRFVSPYTDMVQLVKSKDRNLLLGEGPGAADRADARVAALTGAPLTSPPLVKLVDEYGVFAGLFFAGFVVFALTRRTRDATIAGAILVFYFALSGGLLQAQTIFLAWTLTSVTASAPNHRPLLRRAASSVNATIFVPTYSDELSI
jgi:hypothetical protein